MNTEFICQYSDLPSPLAYVATKNEIITQPTEEEIDRIIEMAWEDRTPFDAIKLQYDALKSSMNHDKQADIEKNKEEIRSLLEEEIVRRYYFQKGRIEAGFDHDVDVQAALKIFADKTAYNKILTTIK
jgi:carboxyl-terminal processing protease